MEYTVSFIDDSQGKWDVQEVSFGGDVEKAWAFRDAKQGIDQIYNVRVWRYITCDCGERVCLQGDVECDCGQWYNGAGQKLRPPHQWEEDY